MTCRHICLSFIVILASLTGHTQASRLNAFEDYADDPWSLTFGASYTTRIVQHSESSANTAYASTGRRIRVPDVHLTLSLIKEFLNTKKISVTALGFAGLAKSTGKSSGESIASLEEKLSGRHFGGGLTLNYNTYIFGLKIQPYLGGRFIAESGQMDLSHTNGSAQLNTVHEYDAKLLHLNVGVRAFDADVNLMSYFEISTPNVLSETYTAKGQVNGSDITISSTTQIDRDPVTFSMGFGYFF